MLEVQNIKKAIDDHLIIEHLNFQVQKGEFVSVIGKSGCGKSTLLNILSGIIKPDAGSIFLQKQCITGKSGHLGYMQQNDLLLPWFTIIDNICLPLRLKGMAKRDATEIALPHLKNFELHPYFNKYPAQLSGGMRQRIALLRTYLFGSPVILFDEPFAKLDAITKLSMQNWLKDFIHETKTTCIFVTHDIDEALYFSNKIHILTNKPAKIKQTFNLSKTDKNQDVEAFSSTSPSIKKEILTLLAN